VRGWASICAIALPILALFACDDPADDRAREVISFAEPVRYTVVSGDSLSKIGDEHGCTAEDLMSWNDLDSDVIEPGQELLVWTIPKPSLPDPTMFASAEDDASGARRRRIGGPRPSPRRASAPSGAPGRPVASGNDEPDAPSGGAALPDRPRSVQGSGIFGSGLDLGSDDGLADAVNDLERGSGPAVGGRRATGDMRNLGAERSGAIDHRPTRVQNGPSFGDGKVRTPKLRMPAAKSCKAQGTRALGDDDMDAGAGLSNSAIKSSIGRVLGTTRRCMPSGTSGRFQVIVELKVGCDGRVKNAYTINGGGAPSAVTDCIESVLSHASFPAHDLPSGQSFQYPINYNF
jgi:hypothetical protein